MCSSLYQRLNASSWAGSMSIHAISSPVPRVLGMRVSPRCQCLMLQQVWPDRASLHRRHLVRGGLTSQPSAPRRDMPWPDWSLHSVRHTARCSPRGSRTGRPASSPATRRGSSSTFDGNACDFATLLARAPADALERIAPEHLTRRHGEAMAAMARLRDDVAAARLDALIVVGDDQEELFQHDNMPAIGIYYGETIRGRLPYQKEIVESDYPCDAALARHLIASLQQDGFDLSVMRSLAEGQREGHAYLVRASLLSAGRRADRAGVPQCLLSAEPAFAGTLRGAGRGAAACGRGVPRRCADRRDGVRRAEPLRGGRGVRSRGDRCAAAQGRGVLPQRAADQADVGQFGDAELDLSGGDARVDGARLGELCSGYRTPALSGTGLCFASFSAPLARSPSSLPRRPAPPAGAERHWPPSSTAGNRRSWRHQFGLAVPRDDVSR